MSVVDEALGAGRELSMMVLPDVDNLSLREIAARSRRIVRSERRGTIDDPFNRCLLYTSDAADE